MAPRGASREVGEKSDAKQKKSEAFNEEKEKYKDNVKELAHDNGLYTSTGVIHLALSLIHI